MHQNQELLVTDCLFYFPKIISLGFISKDTEFNKGKVRKNSRVFTEPKNLIEDTNG